MFKILGSGNIDYVIAGGVLGIIMFYILGVLTVFIPKTIKRFVMKKNCENENVAVRCPIYEDVTENLKLQNQNLTFNMEENSAYDK